jgi:hypothetical protein
MIANTTETFWCLTMYNKIRFTNVRTLAFYTLSFNARVWNIQALNLKCELQLNSR